jgi:hypothetical protein
MNRYYEEAQRSNLFNWSSLCFSVTDRQIASCLAMTGMDNLNTRHYERSMTEVIFLIGVISAF